MKKILIPNRPGAIDSDYEGEVRIILFNAWDEDFKIMKGERITQLVLGGVYPFHFKESVLSETKRGHGGFGSTGR